MQSNVYADLHIHTTASDGTFSPKEAVENAAKIGLGAAAITDHDSVDSLPDALATGKSLGVEIVPGIEMGSDISDRDIHILGYYIDYRDRAFRASLEDLKLKRLSRAEEMCRRLSERGLNVTVGESLKLATGGVLTRAHIARAVVGKGLAPSVSDVFEKHLGNGQPCFVPKYNLSAVEVISVIKDIGGIPVLAHPKLSRIDAEIADFASHGLMGIEAYCLDHDAADVARYISIAENLGLLVTGGSDCHGPRTPGRFMMGACGVDKERFEALKAAGGR